MQILFDNFIRLSLIYSCSGFFYRLILTYEDNTLKSDMGLTTDLISFDFAKAFVTVIHKLLLIQLRGLDFNGRLLSWIEMFLTRTSVCDKFSDSFSRFASVNSGVPQGSILNHYCLSLI